VRKILAVLLALLMTVLAGCDKTIADEENNTTEENNILKEFSLSDDWTDLEFVFGNEKFSFPLFYQDLNKKGWQLEENDDLAAQEFTFNFYKMWNSSFYDENQDLYAYIYVNFQNDENETKKIKDCNIWSIALFKIDDEVSDKGYEIELSKGIKWGSTEEEIVAAYGPVEENYRIDNGEDVCILVYYSLISDMMVQMNMHIYYDGGLYMIELFRYPVE
jgi:hypothetical protein